MSLVVEGCDSPAKDRSYQIQMRVDVSRGNRLIVPNTDELGGGGMRQPGQRLKHRTKYITLTNTDEGRRG
jgi:hypothetical protein